MSGRRRKHLLAVDVGGTKTEVVLAAAGDAWPGIVAREIYPSQQFDALETILADFLARPDARVRASALAAACVCIAGPVEGDRATTTNLEWEVSARALSERFGIPAVRLVNDFAAAGVGISRLAPEDLATLQPGAPQAGGARAIIGAGTGLGVAWMSWDGDDYLVHASEAGHADFAPLDAVQDGLLGYLRRAYGRVSYERVLSGAGLAQIFDYLREDARGAPSQALLDALERAPDPAAVVSAFALERRDAVAERALDVFATVYGAFAGNIALAVLAHGGVYIAGGIAPKIADKLKDGTFIRAFNDKGRFADLLATVPVHVAMNSRVGLFGALELARRLVPRRRRATQARRV